MNIETIRYFEEVARAESFYGAAKRLAVSQQGLNKAITSLERELSTKLLERSRKGVTLTPTGKNFLAFAQKVTADYGEFLDALYNPDEEQKREEDPFNIHVTHYSAQIASATQAYGRPTRTVLVYRGAFRENRLAHMPLGRHRPRVCRPSLQQRARSHREHGACVRPRPSHAIGNRVPCGVIVCPKRVPSSTRGGGRTLRDRRFTRSGAADRVAVSRLSAAECENERRKSAHAHPLRPFAR